MADAPEKPLKPPPARTTHNPTPPDPSAPQHDVRALVGEGREAVIVHKGEAYRLRITANDKLILTK